jgi:hypothetical protein
MRDEKGNRCGRDKKGEVDKRVVWDLDSKD